jgi:hypothetical protein
VDFDSDEAPELGDGFVEGHIASSFAASFSASRTASLRLA